jgi:hypothetical protein
MYSFPTESKYSFQTELKYFEIDWLCTLTGLSGTINYKYNDYEFCKTMLIVYEKFYGDLFKHSIIAHY